MHGRFARPGSASSRTATAPTPFRREPGTAPAAPTRPWGASRARTEMRQASRRRATPGSPGRSGASSKSSSTCSSTCSSSCSVSPLPPRRMQCSAVQCASFPLAVGADPAISCGKDDGDCYTRRAKKQTNAHTHTGAHEMGFSVLARTVVVVVVVVVVEGS